MLPKVVCESITSAHQSRKTQNLNAFRPLLAIPLQKGQISCRELMSGEVLLADVKQDAPIKIDDIDSPYAKNKDLKKLIDNRGL